MSQKCEVCNLLGKTSWIVDREIELIKMFLKGRPGQDNSLKQKKLRQRIICSTCLYRDHYDVWKRYVTWLFDLKQQGKILRWDEEKKAWEIFELKTMTLLKQ